MWLFKKQKSGTTKKPSCFTCVHCGSEDTLVISDVSSEFSSPVKVWRGQRYVIHKCQSCQRLFYSDEPSEGIVDNFSNRLVEDETQLRIAEEELKRMTENRDDRRYLPGGF